MAKSWAASVLAVLVAAIVAGGEVAAQAQSGTSRTFPTSWHTGKITPTQGPIGTTITVSSESFSGSECKSNQVRLRLVRGSTPISGSLTPPINAPGFVVSRPSGSWKGTIIVPSSAGPGDFIATVEGSCKNFPPEQTRATKPDYSDGFYQFPFIVTSQFTPPPAEAGDAPPRGEFPLGAILFATGLPLLVSAFAISARLLRRRGNRT
jgi:hypothetical protein